MAKVARVIAKLLSLALVLIATTRAHAQDTIPVFGPRIFAAPTGSLTQHVETFSLAIPPGAAYKLRIENGQPDGAKRPDTVTIKLNGVPIATTSDLINQLLINRTVQPALSNTLSVAVGGSAGALVRVSLVREQSPAIVVFGPARYIRTSSIPETNTAQFMLPAGAKPPFLVFIMNGLEDGEDRYSSGIIKLNGVEILKDQLQQHIGAASQSVSLQSANTIEVTLTGRPSGTMTLWITATDSTAPTLTVNAPEAGLITRDSVITVSGSVQDLTAVSVTVNGVVASISNGAFSASVPLANDGAHTLTIVATDAGGMSTTVVRHVTRDSQAPVLTVFTPPDLIVWSRDTVTVSGTVTDGTAVTVNANGVSLPVGQGGVFFGIITLTSGPNIITVTATDAAGNTSTVIRQLTYDDAAPLLVVSTPTDGAEVTQDSVLVSGTVTDASTVTVTANGYPLAVATGGNFSGSVPVVDGSNAIVIVATDAGGNTTSVQRTVTRSTQALPPDPATVAPQLDPTVATTMDGAVSFLYTGANPIQRDVAAGTIVPTRVGVLRGRVFNRDGGALPGATITIKGHPEFGSTMSRADGRYDMAVNGGEFLTVNVAKTGYITAQRTVDVPWQDYVIADDIALVALDANATSVAFSANAPVQVARGSVVRDTSGTRQATLVFQPGTQANLVLPNGTTQAVSSLTIRATELTVGPNGLRAMPAALPPASGYTYAVDLSATEAIAAGAKRIDFNQPVALYVDNFLRFPVGSGVPAGYYDPDKGAWISEKNGRVIKVLGVVAGKASVDADGNGSGDSAEQLAALGVTDAELEQLGSTYAAGTSLWRMRVQHFTTYDLNWPRFCGQNGRPPCEIPDSSKIKDNKKTKDNNCEDGSIIECEDQLLGEDVAIPGTPYTLHYRTARVEGRRAEYVIEVPLTGATLPPELKGIVRHIRVAGREFVDTFPVQPNLKSSFVWDGYDAYGRRLSSVQTAVVNVGYVYPVYYAFIHPIGNTDVNLIDDGRSFGLSCSSTTADANNLVCTPVDDGDNFYFGDPRRYDIRWRTMTTEIGGGWDARAASFGGWTLNVHRKYDVASRTLHLGTGSSRHSGWAGSDPANDGDGVVFKIAGKGRCPFPQICPFQGENIPALEANLTTGLDDLAVGPDGTIYFTDQNFRRVRKLTPDGLIKTVAGNGTFGFAGDGGPATSAQLSNLGAVVPGPNGTVYIADRNRIRFVDANGIITTIAGADAAGFSGDGGPATAALLNFPEDLALGPDGTLYIADTYNGRVRKIDPDGRIYTIAGGNTLCLDHTPQAPDACGDGGPALSASLGWLQSIELAPDGTLYIYEGWRIRRLERDGRITHVAGTGYSCEPWVDYRCGDGGSARLAQFGSVSAIRFAPDGALLVGDNGRDVVSRIGVDGRITAIAGIQNLFNVIGIDPEDQPGTAATAARMGFMSSIAVGPDGMVYVADWSGRRILRVQPPLPSYTTGLTYNIASADGNERYIFDPNWRHTATVDVTTGSTRFAFGYDANGLLETITDAHGNITRIDRSANAVAIVGPYGDRTDLTTNGNGYLTDIRQPGGIAAHFTYDASGLMRTYTDPNSNVYQFTYDNLGRLTKDEDPAGGFKTLTRVETANGHRVAVTTKLGRTTTYVLEELPDGRTIRRTIEPTGLETTATVGTDGSVTTVYPTGVQTTQTMASDPRTPGQGSYVKSMTITMPSGLQVATTSSRRVTLSADGTIATQRDSLVVNGRSFLTLYDRLAGQTRLVSPEGRTVFRDVDSFGRALRDSVPGLLPTRYSYDTRGRLSTRSQGSRVSTYIYGADGRLATVVDPMQQTTHFSYDSAGRANRETLPDTTEIRYAFDVSGNLTSLTPPGQPAHEFTYTPVDQTSTYSPPNTGFAPATQYIYNADRDLMSVTHPDSSVVSFGYDPFGRPSTVTFSAGQLTYTFSAATGNVESIAAPGSVGLGYSYDGALPESVSWTGAVTGIVSFAYDSFMRVAAESVNSGNQVTFSYDGDGFFSGVGALSVTRGVDNGLLTGTTLASVQTSQTYNAFAELASLSASFNSSAIFAAQYTRDNVGRIISKTESVAGVTHTYDYKYDAVGRLTEVKLDGGVIDNYEYDGNGNRVRHTGTSGSVTGTYDAQDRLLTYGDASFTYTANGELTTKTTAAGTTAYDYDQLGNLRVVVMPDGTRIEYLIDGQNRRVGKKVDGVLTQGFIYSSQLTPVAELDGSSQLVSRFVYGTRPNAPDYMIKAGVTYRFLTDQLGSVRFVVNASTGAVIQRLEYDAFGRILLDTNPGFQPFGFAGGLYDAHTGLIRFGARDYDALTGTWRTKDPIGFRGGQTNLYTYVGNDPLTHTDASGLCEDEDCLNLVKMLVGSVNMVRGISSAAAGAAAVTGGAATATFLGVVSGPAVIIGGAKVALGLAGVSRGGQQFSESLNDESCGTLKNLLGLLPFGQEYDDPSEPGMLEYFNERGTELIRNPIGTAERLVRDFFAVGKRK